MNGSSISRKPIGRKPVGHFTTSATPQPSVSPASPIMSFPMQQPAPVYGTPTPASNPYQTVAPLPTSAQAPVMQPGSTPVSNQFPSQYPPSVTPLPIRVASSNYATAPVLAPAPDPTYYRHQSPAAIQAQAQAPLPMSAMSDPATAASPQATLNHPSMNSPTAGVQSPVGYANAPSSPTPGHLQRTVTASSVQSLPSELSRWNTTASSVEPSTPLTPVTTSGEEQQDPRTADASMTTCTLCKQIITQNVSIFTCLICSTAQANTIVCVWCYTTGSAASHSHDISYLATDSDIRIQGPTGNIPAHLWTVRKNASGRLWYTHNQTGFRTHVQPLTATGDDAAAATGIPLDWQEMKTPDGKVYYFHAGANVASWAKPMNVLPTGWKMIKTPDGVPFYVHDDLQLSTWNRPGEQPKPKLLKTVAVATTVVKAGKKGKKGSSTASNIATAASVASNVAKLSAAADLSPAGIITATVAAAKLTGLGVKVAGRKMGRLGKMKHMSTATNLIGAAARLTGDDDDDGGDIEECEEVEEVEEVAETQETEETVVYGADYPADVTGPTDTYYSEPPQQDAYVIPEEQIATEQQPYCYPEQPAYPYDPSMVGGPADMPPPQEYPPQQPPVIINNVNVTVEENFTNEVNVQSTEYMETNVYFQNTEYTDVNPYSQQEATITDLSWGDPYAPVDNAQAGFVQTEPVLTEDQPPIQLEQPMQFPNAAWAVESIPQTSGEVPPFVFSPVLAAPLMVSPPTEQGGVVFNPTYV